MSQNLSQSSLPDASAPLAPTGNARIRLLLCDDHDVVREGLAALLAREADIEIVGGARDGQEAVELYEALRPDILLLDLKMPRLSGAQAVAAIREAHPRARAIVLTTYDGDEDIHRALRAGAKAYLLKNAPGAELLRAIRAVHAGQSYIPAHVAAKLAERAGLEELSAREFDVLQLLARGHSNRDIARALFISEATVKGHLNNLFLKLEVSSRVEAVAVAIRRGLVRDN